MDCLFIPPLGGAALGSDCPVHWQMSSGEGRSLSLAECAAQLQGRPVALVLPMEMASAFVVSLPTQKARLMRQALTYTVEEMLAEDVELFHLALGAQLPDGRFPVVAIRRDRLAGWLEELEDLGIKVAAIHMDADLLPRDGEQLLVIGGRALLGGACETRLAFPVGHWSSLGTMCKPETQPRQEDEPYRSLSAGLAGAVDLAQGEFAPRRENRAWAVWRPFMALAGFAVLAFLAFNMTQAWLLERSGDAYAKSSEALYRELFPEDKRIVNLKAQFAEHLSQGNGTQGGFIALLDQASSAIGEAHSSLTVSNVDYSQTRGDLALQVRAKDFAELEKLRLRLVKAGLSVQLGSASREEGGVTARVVLGGGA